MEALQPECSELMASIRVKRLSTGHSACLVRFRAPDGKERTKQFKRKRDADRYAQLIEIDRAQGSFVDPRLGKLTVGECGTGGGRPFMASGRPLAFAMNRSGFHAGSAEHRATQGVVSRAPHPRSAGVGLEGYPGAAALMGAGVGGVSRNRAAGGFPRE